jgi:hypothetical protein
VEYRKQTEKEKRTKEYLERIRKTMDELGLG